MSRILLLLRHGKSSWDSGAPSDFDRPLAGRGKRDAPRMGAWLRREDLVPDHVVSSPARRARKTAEKACRAMGLAAEAVHHDARVYAAARDDLLQVLADCPPDAPRVLLVGHNPGLEDLLAWLGGEAVTVPGDGKLLPTATVAALELPDDWSGLGAGSARPLLLMRPKQLPPDLEP
jgi:phosphohistidine phosphatase